VAVLDDHKHRFGVEPICRVRTEHGVQIAASTYYARKTRPPSARSVNDEQLLDRIVEIFYDPRRGRGV
jgi:putative transposase